MNTSTVELDEIPEFLRRTPERQAEINKWNAEHPIVAVAWSNTPSEERERRVTFASIAAEEAERQKQQAASRRARRDMETKSGRFVSAKRLPGTDWDASLGRWVDPNYMPPSKFQRLMRQMPTQAHRDALIKLYGAGQGASLGGDVAKDAKRTKKARPESAPVARRSRRKADVVESRVSAAPAEAKPKEATQVSRPASLGTIKAKRVPKEEQVAHVKAMLTRPEGATLAELGAKYGWQEHSTSAFLSVNFRNQGVATTKEKVAGRGTVYRVVS